jgi:hypothetical protein
MTTMSLKSTDQVHQLADRLKQMPRVRASAHRQGTSIEEEAWQIATALSDVEESAQELFGTLVPRLLNAAPDGEETNDIVNEIGEAYRHILYHILDTKMFGYVVPRD